MRVTCVANTFAVAAAATGNPIAKVLTMLEGMRGKVVQEGEAEQQSYEEFAGWCRTEAKNMQREVEDAKGSVTVLEATLQKAQASIQDLTADIDRLSKATAEAQGELKDAEEVRKKEAADYEAVDRELKEAIDTLSRAIVVLQRRGSVSSFSQLAASPAVGEILEGLRAVVAGSVVETQSKTRLEALLQGDSDPASGEKSAAVLATLNELLEKAEAQKADADRAELEGAHQHALMKQSLASAVVTTGKEQEQAKQERRKNEEIVADTQGELATEREELADDQKSLADAHAECQERAHHWDVAMQSRDHEVHTLDQAIKILEKQTNGAQEKAYSFIQLDSHDSVPVGEVVKALVEVGKRYQDRQIAMLAMRVRSAGGAHGVFDKIKGLISGMISKLEAEAADEAKAKDFCNAETAKADAKQGEHKSELGDIGAQLDSHRAKVARLKREVTTLTKELKDIAGEQAEATKVRSAEKAEFEKAAKDYKDGITAVHDAIRVLRAYFGEALIQGPSKEDGGNAVVGLLEVAESDFARLLAEATDIEQAAQEEFEELTGDNQRDTVVKRKDIEGKKREIAEVESRVSEDRDDQNQEQDEASAVDEYISRLRSKCVAKGDPYEERQRRRAQEMDGLRNALAVLEGEAMALMQVRRYLRRA
mmetsp:Transcript_107904/g.247357  ORF Transcript_107904/g.247357 Transcript_107904/m.247357 type:complete len:652 (+) Transcript_107904:70-2025(+)